MSSQVIEQKQKILNFFNTQKHMVISTVNAQCNTESALIGFGNRDDLTLIFGTSTKTRKYQNILKNNNVSIVFGNLEMITIQYQGVVTMLDGDELEEYKKAYYKKNPLAKKYEHFPNQVYCKVTPNWIRYTDYNVEPEEIFELTL